MTLHDDIKAEKDNIQEFQEALADLINRHSIENFVDMPDFLLAEHLVEYIRVLGRASKKNSDWHCTGSVRHPAEIRYLDES